MRFSLREMLLVVTCVCIACGWFADRQSLKREILAHGLWAERFEDRLNEVERASLFSVGRRGAYELIYALGDPDRRVGRAADLALRRISGMKNGFGDDIESSDRRRLEITAKWIEWYLADEQ